MKIFQINFIKQNNIASAPKRNNLAPLAFDTVSFSANRPKDIPYSIYQRDREIAVMKSVLEDAIVNSVILTPEEISEKSGLDIYVVKLRLSTNNAMGQLDREMRASPVIKGEAEKLINTHNIKSFLELLSMSKKRLTDSEMAFYLGLEKDKFLELIKEAPQLEEIYNKALFQTKNCPLLEKKEQNRCIKNAINNIAKKDTYDSFVKKTGLSSDILRARADEDSELFDFLTEHFVYPPEIYPANKVEMQDDAIFKVIIRNIKENKTPDTKEIARKAGLYPIVGLVDVRLKSNTALGDAYRRMIGADRYEN